MAKYGPLTAFLRMQMQEKDTIQVSFRRLEQIIAAALPPGARSDPAWWGDGAERPSVQANAWRNAGWEVAGLDLPGESVTFTHRRPRA